MRNHLARHTINTSMRDTDGIQRMAALSVGFYGGDEHHFLHHLNETRMWWGLPPVPIIQVKVTKTCK